MIRSPPMDNTSENESDKPNREDYNRAMVSMDQTDKAFFSSLKRHLSGRQRHRVNENNTFSSEDDRQPEYQQGTTTDGVTDDDIELTDVQITEPAAEADLDKQLPEIIINTDEILETLEEEMVGLAASANHMAAKRKARKIIQFKQRKVEAQTKKIKLRIKKKVHTYYTNVREMFAYAFDVFTIGLYHRFFSKIEGKFGSGCVSYFSFIRWIFVFNFFVSLIVFAIFVFPSMSFSQDFYKTVSLPDPSSSFSDSNSSTTTTVIDNINRAIYCSQVVANGYKNTSDKANATVDLLLDFIQGTGWMLTYPIFLGSFINHTKITVSSNENDTLVVSYISQYNTPLIIIIVLFAYVLLAVFGAVGSSNVLYRNITKSLVDRKTKIKLSNEVFTAWDFGLKSPKMIKQRHRLINSQLKSAALIFRQKRAATEKPLVAIRIFTNSAVTISILAAAYMMFYATQRQLMILADQSLSSILRLTVEYLPQLILTALNLILPTVFSLLLPLEDYSPSNEVIVSLMRIVALKLISLVTLIITMGTLLICPVENQVCGSCIPSRCWENYIGQEMYKLTVLDFFISIVVVPFLDVLRWLVNKKVKLFKFVPQNELEISVQVLNLVYTQSVCFMGAFFCPYIVPISCLSSGLLFHVKRWTLPCLKISSNSYRTAKLERFFLDILLFFFLVLLIPLCTAIFSIKPSQGCSPFRIHPTSDFYMVTALTSWIANGWQFFTIILIFLTSDTVYYFVLIFFVIVIYFYYTVLRAQNLMINLLQHELNTETNSKHEMLQLEKQAQRHKKSAFNYY